MFVLNGTVSLRDNWFVGSKYRNLNIVVGECWKDRGLCAFLRVNVSKVLPVGSFLRNMVWLEKVKVKLTRMSEA